MPRGLENQRRINVLLLCIDVLLALLLFAFILLKGGLK